MLDQQNSNIWRSNIAEFFKDVVSIACVISECYIFYQFDF